MAVSIDTVYQTVLALASKDQKGYITPQEFNLFAKMAQVDIFEQYFYDLDQFKRNPGSSDPTVDMVNLIEDKISIFHMAPTLDATNLQSDGNTKFIVPEDFYRFKSARTGSSHNDVGIEKLSRNDFWQANQSPLTKGSLTRPNCYMQNEGYEPNSEIWVNPSGILKLYLNYIRKPLSPKWTYITIGDTAIFNPSVDAGWQDFELHPSEEKSLVDKILKYSGTSTRDQYLGQVGAAEEQMNIQQEKR